MFSFFLMGLIIPSRIVNNSRIATQGQDRVLNDCCAADVDGLAMFTTPRCHTTIGLLSQVPVADSTLLSLSLSLSLVSHWIGT